MTLTVFFTRACEVDSALMQHRINACVSARVCIVGVCERERYCTISSFQQQVLQFEKDSTDNNTLLAVGLNYERERENEGEAWVKIVEPPRRAI